MVQAKCTKKIKNKQGKIICYVLMDFNGQTKEVEADILKRAIRLGDINVVNLSLTSDGRLISKSEAGLKGLRELNTGLKNCSGKALELAVSIGNEWWRYLDEGCYGVVTNTIARVGHITKKSEVASRIGKFVCFADFNSLTLPNYSGYAVGMTDERNGLLCKIYACNKKIKTGYYYLDKDSFIYMQISRFYSLDTDVTEAAKELASLVNELALEKLKENFIK